jgi:hypothetical protein
MSNLDLLIARVGTIRMSARRLLLALTLYHCLVRNQANLKGDYLVENLSRVGSSEVVRYCSELQFSSSQ